MLSALSTCTFADSINVLRTIALTGDEAPGLGVYFNWHQVPVINNEGAIAFASSLTAGHDGGALISGGVFVSDDGVLRSVVNAGRSVYGQDSGVYLRSVGNVNLADDGNIAFRAVLAGDGVTERNDRAAFWALSEGGLSSIYRSGSEVPGGGGVLDPQSGDFSLNIGSGESAAYVSLYVSGGEHRMAVFSGSERSRLSRAVSEDDVVSTGRGDEVISALDGLFVANGSGDYAVHGFVGGNTTTAIIAGHEGEDPEALVIRGDPVPGVESELQQVGFTGLGRPRINDAGDIAFIGAIGGSGADFNNDKGVFLYEREEGMSLAVRVGEEAPGSGGDRFRTFTGLVLNRKGELAFESRISSDESSYGGVALFSNGGDRGLRMIARQGEPVPGISDPRIVYGGGFRLPVINSRGQVAFRATLSTPRGYAYGLFAEDVNGKVQLIARTEARMDVSNELEGPDYRSVFSINFAGDSGNEDGLRSGFNDTGELVFWARFTDGTTGVFLSEAARVPEPGMSVMVGVVVLTFCLRMRGRWLLA